MRLGNVNAVMRKEFLHLIRDARSLILAFAIPLMLIILFGYALSLDVDDVRTVVVDYDRTDASRDFIGSLDSSPYFRVTGHPDSADGAVSHLDQGSATLAVVIPAGFAADLRGDRPSPVQVLLDGSDPNFANIARGYITSFVERYNRNLLLKFLDRNGMQPVNPPVDARVRVWFNEDLESRKFIVPGIIAIIIMIAGAMLTSLVIAREFENGTMETIKSLPITALEFIIGKAVPYFFITLIDVLTSVLLGQVLFGVVMKMSFLFMILASSLYIMVALALGLFISSVLKSQLMANQGAVLITYLPSFLLSDFVFPITNMPVVLQAVTYVVPARYYMHILFGIYLKDLGFMHLWHDFAVLAAMLVVLSLATARILMKEGL